MPILRYLKKIEFLHLLIKKRGTGCQKEFARRANMSRSLLNSYLREMKELGFPIKYSKSKGSYYYTEDVELVKTLVDFKIEKDIMESIKGAV